VTRDVRRFSVLAVVSGVWKKRFQTLEARRMGPLPEDNCCAARFLKKGWI
jgi:hypothetical protein